MKKTISGIAVAFSLAGMTHASVIIDNFDFYTDGTNMNGQGGWTVTNGLTSGSDPIVIATSFTFDGSDGAALIGGLEPDTPNSTVSLSRSANLTLADFSTGVARRFEIDFGFLDALDIADPRNPYSIVVDTNNGNLLTINLAPGASLNTYTVSFSSAFFAFAGTADLDALDTFGNPYYPFAMEIWTEDNSTVQYQLFSNNALFNSGVLAGANPGDLITGMSINVDTDGGAGEGFLVVDNVTLIPEPSTALLGLISAAFCFTRRRR